MWNILSGQEVETFRGARGYVTAVTFRPGGHQLAAAASDGTVRVWGLGQGHPSLGLLLPVGFADGRSARFRPYQDRGVQRFELAVSAFPGARPLYTIRPVDTRMKWAYSPAGRLAAVRGRTLLVWDAADGRELFRRETGGGEITALDLSRDGRRLLAGDGRTLGVYDAASGTELLSLQLSNSSGRVALSPDGQRFACFAGANAEQVVPIQIRDAATGDLLGTVRERGRAVTRVAFSPDGRRLASVGGSRITIWDLATSREVGVLAGHALNTLSLAFSPDGQRLASGGGDRRVKVWDLATGRELLALRGHPLYVSDVAFSADGHRVLSRGTDVRIWDGAPLPAGPEPEAGR